MIMENLELNFKLTVANINTILKHLGAGAYAEVAELVTIIHGQAKPQVEAAASAPATAPVEDNPTV